MFLYNKHLSFSLCVSVESVWLCECRDRVCVHVCTCVYVLCKVVKTSSHLDWDLEVSR